MADNYRKICNALALSQVKRTPYIPRPSCAIGPAENLAPVPVVLYRNLHNREAVADPITPEPAEMPVEKMGILGQGEPVTTADFAGNFWLGNPLGGDV